MSGSKHTPGPWTVSYPLRSSERPRIKTADKQEIALVAKVHGGTTELTYNCNAKLIAAAPDMANLLEEWQCFVLHGTSRRYSEREMLEWTAAVLAKAGL